MILVVVIMKNFSGSDYKGQDNDLTRLPTHASILTTELTAIHTAFQRIKPKRIEMTQNLVISNSLTEQTCGR